MRWNQWMRWLRRRSDNDFAAEIESHLAMEVERLVASGVSRDEALFAARRAFGNVTSRQEQFHEGRVGSGFESLRQDVRHGLRSMRRTPGFTAVAVLSLAIGIGANTTMFGAIDALLFRAPAHVKDAARIHRVYFEMPTPTGEMQPWPRQSYATYLSIRDDVAGVEGAAAFWTQKISSGRGPDARSLDAVAATPSYFSLLGVHPALGRFFAPDEELDDGDHVAVLAYEAWHGQYNGDSTVVGRTIDVAGTPYTIVGVAPESFTGINLDRVDLWLPIGVASRLLSPGVVGPSAGGAWLEIVVKRRDGVSDASITPAITQLYRDRFRGSRRYATTYAKANAILGPIVAGRGPVPGADAKVSLWVAVVSVLVLLIASANVANLLLLRGLTRSREVALRLSLGATRWRVTRQWLVEGMLLSVVGALCAIVLARWTSSAMLTFLLPSAVKGSVFAPRFLVFTSVVALGTGLLASIVPALVIARRDFGPLLGSGRAAGGPGRLAVQRTLIGAQVALATLLLVGAGLFVSSLRNVRAIDLGVDVDHVLYVNVDFGSPRKLSHDQNATASANAVYAAMVERVRRVPGVASAALTVGEPLGRSSAIALQRRGAPPLVEGAPVPFVRNVGSDYFQAMGTSLLRGRLFTAADHAPNAHVAIVDEETARQYLPGGSGLDPCVYLGDGRECTEVVGVVKNVVRWELVGDKGSVVYLPFESWPGEAISTLVVKAQGDPKPLIPAIRQAVTSASPDLPWADIRPISEQLAPQFRPWRLGASMFTVFSALALGLAAVGLFGLLSYMVTQRAHEIGVRKALGAPSSGIIGMVLRGALGMTLVGLGIGVTLALLTGRFVASQLYGVSPRDPVVITVSAATLVFVTIVACFAPAHRATRVDPMIALRME
jgi:putative ABC transport system permease protein